MTSYEQRKAAEATADISDHVLPSGKTYGQETRRASIVAQLRGYTALEPDATEDSLKAEYLALMREPYLTAEEEASTLAAKALTEREARESAEYDTDRQIIAEAEANGFMACRAIRDALGWDKPKPNGFYYSSLQVAYRWIEDAGEEVVYLIPDGITDVTKSERTGCYPDVFARVLAYKVAHVEKRRHAEWESRRDAAQQVVDFYAQKDPATRKDWLMDPDKAFDDVGPEPVWDVYPLEAAEARKRVKAASDEERILAAMREYTGPLNKRGYPKGPFMGLRGKAKQALWDRRNE